MNYIILGAGGIGYHIAEPLARIICYPPACVKDSIKDPILWIVDGDVVEDHNLGRQHGAKAVGINKASVLADHVSSVFPELQIQVIKAYLSDQNQAPHRDWLKSGLTVFGCVDNNSSRCFLETLLDDYDDFTWVDGGNDLDSGQAMLWRRAGGSDMCPSLTSCNPEMLHPTSDDAFPDQRDCSKEWPSQPQLALANQAVAQAMLQLWFTQVLNKPVDQPRFNMILVDITEGRATPQTQYRLTD